MIPIGESGRYLFGVSSVSVFYVYSRLAVANADSAPFIRPEREGSRRYVHACIPKVGKTSVNVTSLEDCLLG